MMLLTLFWTFFQVGLFTVGGGYAFAGWPLGQRGEEEAAGRAYKIMRDEVHWYGRKGYGYTDD